MSIAASQNGFAACLLHLLNILFAIAGLLLSIGIVVVYALQVQGKVTVASSSDISLLWILIALGMVILCTALLGFCGLCMRSKAFLVLYALLAIVIFIVNLVLAVLVIRSGSSTGQFWGDVSDRAGIPIYGLLFLMCALELLVIIASCTLLGSQRKRSHQLAQQRMDPNYAMPMYQPQHQQQYQPSQPATVYTGPAVAQQKEYVEYVEEEAHPTPTAPVQDEPEYEYEELDPDYMNKHQQVEIDYDSDGHEPAERTNIYGNGTLRTEDIPPGLPPKH